MTRVKSIASMIIGGFLLFAPPGTLVFIALVLAGWLGGVASIAVALAGLSCLGIAWLVIRRRAAKRRTPGRRCR